MPETGSGHLPRTTRANVTGWLQARADGHQLLRRTPNHRPLNAHRSKLARATTTHTITQPRANVLVVVEDVVEVVRGLHVHQPAVDGVAVRLADPAGGFVGAEEVDVDAFAEAAESGEESLRPSGVPVAEVLAGPPYTING